MSALSERELAVLRVLAEQTEALHAGRVGVLAFPEKVAGRRDTGAQNTLRALERRGLVDGRYSFATGMASTPDSLYWKITDAGRRALAEEATWPVRA